MDSRAEGVQIGNVEPYKSTSLLKFDSIMVKAWWEIELLMWIAQCQKPTIWEWLIPSIKKKTYFGDGPLLGFPHCFVIFTIFQDLHLGHAGNA
jgi:hypothetical protein